MQHLTTDVQSLTKHITVTLHLKGVKKLRVRLWVARQIMRLGAFVGGFGFKTDE